MPSVRIKRGTRAQISSAAAANGLKQGELYHVTDENRVDVGTGTNASSALATKSEVDGKEPTISAGTTAQYWRGDKTWQTLNKSSVGLGNVDNTSDSTKAVLSAAKLTTARTIGGVSFDGSANINLPGVNAAGNQNTTGNAATATKLATARTINGVSFDGTANITVADSTKLPLTGGTVTGELISSAGNSFRMTQGNYGVFWRNDGTDTYLFVTASGDQNGSFTAARPFHMVNATGVASINGNAATATKLATARTINGVSFDGTANITVADATKLPTTGGNVSGNLHVTSGVLGYGTGAGGTVTQTTSKSTAVTLNKACGQITTHNAALAAGAYVNFDCITTFAYDCTCVANIDASTPTYWNYRVEATATGLGLVVFRLTNISPVSMSENVVINFALLKIAAT